jgi:hypothetical protein
MCPLRVCGYGRSNASAGEVEENNPFQFIDLRVQVRDFLDKYLVYYLRTCRRRVLSQVRAFWGRLRTPVRWAAWGAFEQVCRPVAVAGFGLALLAIGGNITDRPMRVYWKYKTKYAI